MLQLHMHTWSILNIDLFHKLNFFFETEGKGSQWDEYGTLFTPPPFLLYQPLITNTELSLAVLVHRGLANYVLFFYLL